MKNENQRQPSSPQYQSQRGSSGSPGGPSSSPVDYSNFSADQWKYIQGVANQDKKRNAQQAMSNQLAPQYQSGQRNNFTGIASNPNGNVMSDMQRGGSYGSSGGMAGVARGMQGMVNANQGMTQNQQAQQMEQANAIRKQSSRPQTARAARALNKMA